MHPGVASILKHFRYEHLPEHLQEVSAPLCDLARSVARSDRYAGPELTAGLRKLLEAKDCLVRAAIEKAEADTVPITPMRDP